MKTLVFLSIVTLAVAASATDTAKWPGGRVVITCDGNAHDPDDIGGTPMSLALMHAAGLADRLVHVDYANHFVHSGHAGAASKPELLKEITFSTVEAARRFDIPAERVFDCQTQLEAATASFVREARRSSANDPLWLICAGPMTTAHRYLAAVKAADADTLRFVRCVSHSAANGRHDPDHTWDGLKQKFPEAVFHLIKNQNTAGGERGLCSPLEHWDWLKNSTDDDLRWLHTRNRTAHSNAGKFDVSDAGMVYWVLSGAGHERAGVDEFRALLEKPRTTHAQDDATLIRVEAESFQKQARDDVRKWEVMRAGELVEGASGGAFIQVLPDTRRSQDDKLVRGENFSDEPGAMAVLSYKINLPEAGRYFVWARTFSTGTEDNGLHFGLDGQWPESGRRWQTVRKNGWHWDCKQRTEKVHTGVPMQLWLDVATVGEHELMLSMREDGTRVDALILAKSPEFRPPGVNYAAAAAVVESPAPPVSRQPDGSGAIAVSGELQQWHKVTLTFDGPFAAESDTAPNPFTDLAFNVTFTHESGSPKYTVPGYFAADGKAAESSATAGTKWRAHLSPDKTGTWNYAVSFTRGKNAALDGDGEALKPFDGVSGSFQIAASDKAGRDFRARGRLQYVGKPYLQFAGSKEYFLKAGPDSPETLLAYSDFDNTSTEKSNTGPLKTWAPHAGDWKAGDPTWKDGKGKNLIGALNYLADKGVNAFSFLTYNAAGDGDNVWPFIERNAKLHYDCSKLDQWGIVFDHATQLGLYLHFKLQENESDDNRRGPKREVEELPEALDEGRLGIERKLYCRELIARFGHALALNWNIGEENTQSTDEVRDMVKYLHDTDPYRHHIVLHTFPPEMDKVYRPLLGDKSLLSGVSMQTGWKMSHKKTLQWRKESAEAGRAWVVAHDEQNPASLGVPPDPGYQGHSGIALEKDPPKGKAGEGFISSDAYTMHDIRKSLLWGHFLAGGAGLEYYFGYKLPENDLNCEDFRSRDKSWDYCRIALDFFSDEKIPFTEMSNANALIGNSKDDNEDGYCFAKPGELYLVYLPSGGSTELDLSAAKGSFTVQWFNPREGGKLREHGPATVDAGGKRSVTAPSTDDWLAMIARTKK